MHCASCAGVIEKSLKKIDGVETVEVNIGTEKAKISFDESKTNAEQFSKVIAPLGYTLVVSEAAPSAIAIEKQSEEKKWAELATAAPIALVFIALFVLLQKLGIVNLITTSDVSYGTAFMIGIVASLSTCMAVVGGLVLSMSATFAKEGDRVRPQVLFHLGRLVSFFILGGVIGALGSAFTLNTVGTFVLGLLVAVVMLLLGINLLDLFPWAKRFQPAMPKFLARHALGVSEFTHWLTPLLVGVATFFLPCGFTQAMQLYSLSTGSFLSGALTMSSFALGTLPVLALIGFSSFSVKNSPKAGIFFKTAGLIVILFAMFNLINSLVVIGLISPVFNF